jgi:hypothetical protein
MEYIGRIVLFNNNELNVLGDKIWDDISIGYFIENIEYLENIFNTNIDIIQKNKYNSIYCLFDEVNLLFNRARLLKSYPELRNKYLALIKRYLPYIKHLTCEEYILLMKNESCLMEQCFLNIPSIKGDIRTILIKYDSLILNK